MNHRALRAAALAAAALLCAPAAGAQDAPSLRDLSARLLAAGSEEERAPLREAILAAGPGAADLVDALAAGPALAPDAPVEWLERTVAAPDGTERPYLLHVPSKYDPARRYPMLIDMHGGVSRPAPLTHEELLQMKFFWGAEAEEREWFLAFPSGERGCTWWEENGAGMVLSILAETRRLYGVDDDRVFATGFSDGGSGAYYLAAAHPTPFAGFIPLSGHPSVAGMGGTPIFLRNFRNRPLWAVNTEEDSLYPSRGLRPIFAAMLDAGVPLVWRSLPKWTHNPMYLPEVKPEILAWLGATVRDPWPATVHWEGVEGSPGRVGWIEVTGVSGGSGKEPFPDRNPTLVETRVRIGVRLDPAFEGPGARIEGVVDGSAAKAAGLAAGDVILAVDGTEVPGARAIRGLLAGKTFGDRLELRWRRGEEVLEAAATIPPAESEPAFDRSRPWGSLRATVAGNRFEITCVGIRSLRLLLDPRRIDLSAPVTVVVNGTALHEEPAAFDPRECLDRALVDRDRSLIPAAFVEVEVPGP